MLRSSLRRYPKVIADSVLRRACERATLPATPRAASPLAPPALPAPDAPSPLGALWIGHATVLLRVSGLHVITDPVFSHRIGLRLGGYTIGPHRRQPPALLPPQLPPIDLVLLSHAHFDHLDTPSLAALASRRTHVFTARGISRLVPPGFGSVSELDWDEHADVPGVGQALRAALGDRFDAHTVPAVRVRAVAPNHWGARTGYDRWRGCNAYVLESPPGSRESRRVLFAGDTAFTDAFDQVREPDLAIFGIGAYDPWIHAHADPEQVWTMFRTGEGRALLPMHHSTFELSDEPAHEPLERLLRIAGAHERLVVAHRPGDLWTPEQASTAPPSPTPGV